MGSASQHVNTTIERFLSMHTDMRTQTITQYMATSYLQCLQFVHRDTLN